MTATGYLVQVQGRTFTAAVVADSYGIITESADYLASAKTATAMPGTEIGALLDWCREKRFRFVILALEDCE